MQTQPINPPMFTLPGGLSLPIPELLTRLGQHPTYRVLASAGGNELADLSRCVFGVDALDGVSDFAALTALTLFLVDMQKRQEEVLAFIKSGGREDGPAGVLAVFYCR